MTGSLIDVCLALLLIGAAAGTLVGADAEAGAGTASSPSRASGTAEMLASSTAAVEYTLSPVREGAGTDRGAASPEATRVAHATLAEHLARAAVRSTTFDAPVSDDDTTADDGAIPSATVTDYRRAVRETVAETIGPRTRVRAVWRPLPCDDRGGADRDGANRGGADRDKADRDGRDRIGGEVTVGPRPPASTTVHAARFAVPVAPSSEPISSDRVDADKPSRAAVRTVAVLFPPDRVAAAARGDSAAAAAVIERYRAVGDAMGVDAVGALERGGPREANRELATALAERYSGDGVAEETSPCGLGDPNRVTVVVRTWSP
ncbi:DUF7284 family protein [Halobaculum roseum]|uniref:SIMPL domain-containing protein n=1 Tax=Halobaculum roseum TaxID=2175149 RepID=A0ABD5MLY8_9EURY|nr:hypothetical protein [Halobaculum roseum]QZY02631.1 hypothetical protein K6T36_00065 [Halobaculum roseum]